MEGFLQKQNGRFKAMNFYFTTSDNEKVQFYIVVTPENEQRAKELITSFSEQFMEQAKEITGIVFGVFMVMSVIIIIQLFVVVTMCCRRPKNRGSCGAF
ncbi:hypothetical protein L596_010703 [Steinernema carpocapsae]|uniref:Uncharacterized protein n=1 Tax=Steinernema carpocapsae TaxID=34508 RepID=A0A4U5PKW8_STECR|nr:hypothetical protein L596_010703 [Steinernema carpocapsae]